jgi:hypothetical protein
VQFTRTIFIPDISSVTVRRIVLCKNSTALDVAGERDWGRVEEGDSAACLNSGLSKY